MNVKNIYHHIPRFNFLGSVLHASSHSLNSLTERASSILAISIEDSSQLIFHLRVVLGVDAFVDFFIMTFKVRDNLIAYFLEFTKKCEVCIS